MRIGRYEIKLGRYCWVQTHVPTTVRCYLGFIWVFKEAIPTDVDKTQKFLPGTPLQYEGRRYRYYKAAGPLNKGELGVRR